MEYIKTVNRYTGREDLLGVSKRAGEWALVKHRYGYSIYHAPQSEIAKKIPDNAIDGTLRAGRSFIGYRPGLAALKSVAERFPNFGRSHGELLELRDFLAQRQAVAA